MCNYDKASVFLNTYGSVEIHRLTRAQYDAFPGTNEMKLERSETWTKQCHLNGITVTFYTDEPPTQETQT